jgi:hypothetical protein
MKFVEIESQLACLAWIPPAMSLRHETVLTTIPASETERLLVVLVQDAGRTSHMELRQQSFSNGIGWFTQSSVSLEPSQVALLRNAIGSKSAGQSTARSLPREFSTIAAPAWEPKVVRADSA